MTSRMKALLMVLGAFGLGGGIGGEAFRLLAPDRYELYVADSIEFAKQDSAKRALESAKKQEKIAATEQSSTYTPTPRPDDYSTWRPYASESWKKEYCARQLGYQNYSDLNARAPSRIAINVLLCLSNGNPFE